MNEKCLHATAGLDIEPREYNILTKSRIKDVFDTRIGPGALDHRPYVAAASVLPMRTNNYVVWTGEEKHDKGAGCFLPEMMI